MELDLQIIAIVAPITVGIVKALTMAKLPSNWAPMVALAVGIAVAFAVTQSFTPTVWITGIIAALTSQGLYDQITKAKEVIAGK